MNIVENDMKNGLSGTENDWHVLYTRFQYERSVAYSLSIKGHDVFLPTYGAAHRWQDRTKQLLMPLFPSYVFIRGGMDRQLQILSTPGLISIVGWTAGRPAIVPQEQIESVRLIVLNPKLVEPHPYLECGTRVRVEAGPLLGLEGILVRKKAITRLIVSMEILGRSAAVEIDFSHVVRIPPSPIAEPAHPFLYPRRQTIH